MIWNPLDELLQKAENLLERRWREFLPPPHDVTSDTAALLLRGFVVIARNTFKTMRFICADKPPDPDRKPDFARAAPPLARVILEVLFTVTFMLEDLPARVRWFERAGWRSMHEDLERLRGAYQADPDWREVLSEREERLLHGRLHLGVTEEQVANPRQIPRWPIPSKMKHHAPALKEHFQFLEDWFYGHLSADAHVSWPGFVRHAGPMLKLTSEDLPIRDQAERFVSASFRAAAPMEKLPLANASTDCQSLLHNNILIISRYTINNSVVHYHNPRCDSLDDRGRDRG